MIEVSVAIAGRAPLVCVPATWGEVSYLGGTGQQGAPTREEMAWLIDDHVGAATDPGELDPIDYPGRND